MRSIERGILVIVVLLLSLIIGTTCYANEEPQSLDPLLSGLLSKEQQAERQPTSPKAEETKSHQPGDSTSAETVTPTANPVVTDNDFGGLGNVTEVIYSVIGTVTTPVEQRRPHPVTESGTDKDTDQHSVKPSPSMLPAGTSTAQEVGSTVQDIAQEIRGSLDGTTEQILDTVKEVKSVSAPSHSLSIAKGSEKQMKIVDPSEGLGSGSGVDEGTIPNLGLHRIPPADFPPQVEAQSSELDGHRAEPNSPVFDRNRASETFDKKNKPSWPENRPDNRSPLLEVKVPPLLNRKLPGARELPSSSGNGLRKGGISTHAFSNVSILNDDVQLDQFRSTMCWNRIVQLHDQWSHAPPEIPPKDSFFSIKITV